MNPTLCRNRRKEILNSSAKDLFLKKTPTNSESPYAASCKERFSKPLRNFRQVLDCGSPLPLFVRSTAPVRFSSPKQTELKWKISLSIPPIPHFSTLFYPNASTKAAQERAHSKTLSRLSMPLSNFRQVVECGCQSGSDSCAAFEKPIRLQPPKIASTAFNRLFLSDFSLAPCLCASVVKKSISKKISRPKELSPRLRSRTTKPNQNQSGE